MSKKNDKTEDLETTTKSDLETSSKLDIESSTKSDLEKIKIQLRKYPTKPSIGVGAIIKFNEKILLIKRKYDPYAGLWTIPGGNLELGETVEECCKREILEETGLKIGIESLAGVVDLIEKDESNKIVWDYVLINYVGKILQDQISIDTNEPESYLRLNSESSSAKFVATEDLKNYNLTPPLEHLFTQMGYL